jgi:hypothetical protein
LANGFTTTAREKKVFDDNQEFAVQQMAKTMGITIKPGKKGIKVKVNDPCPCGSGKKVSCSFYLGFIYLRSKILLFLTFATFSDVITLKVKKCCPPDAQGYWKPMDERVAEPAAPVVEEQSKE